MHWGLTKIKFTCKYCQINTSKWIFNNKYFLFLQFASDFQWSLMFNTYALDALVTWAACNAIKSMVPQPWVTTLIVAESTYSFTRLHKYNEPTDVFCLPAIEEVMTLIIQLRCKCDYVRFLRPGGRPSSDSIYSK